MNQTGHMKSEEAAVSSKSRETIITETITSQATGFSMCLTNKVGSHQTEPARNEQAALV